VSPWWREFFDEDYPLLYAGALGPERTEREVAGAAAILKRGIDAVPGLSRAVFRIQRPDQPDVVKEFRHRLYSATDLAGMLRKAGYERIECFGDYDRRAFAIDSPVFLAHAS
jgi:hypothetical protein